MPFLLDLNFQNQKSRQNCVHVWGFCTWSSSHIYILCINIYVTNIMDTNFSLSFSLLNNVDLKQLTLPITPFLSLVWLGPWECAPTRLYPHLLPSPRLSTSRWFCLHCNMLLHKHFLHKHWCFLKKKFASRRKMCSARSSCTYWL